LLGDARDAADELRERVWRVGDVRYAIEGRDHVVGREVASVVERNTSPKLELPGRVVDRAPARRQAWLELLLGIDEHERVVDHHVRRARRKCVEEVRVERVQLELRAEHERLRECRRHEERGKEDSDGVAARGS
jgi:DNA-binding response OmpR family regulator